MTGLLRLLFGPSIRIAALVIARPLQLVDEALADVDTEYDVDEPIPYELPALEFTYQDACWLYWQGVKP